MKTFLQTLSLLLISTLILSACSKSEESTLSVDSNQKQINIVTSFIPLYSLTANLIEGTNANLQNLVSPGASIHTFSLKPSDAINLEKADLIVINGAQLETFMDNYLSENQEKIVDTSDGIALLKNRLIHDEHESEADHDEEKEAHENEQGDSHDEEVQESGHDDEHGEFDPHFWLDPKNAIKQAHTIKSALIALDSENREIYENNFVLLKNRLESLDDQIRSEISQLNVEPFIVFHDAYQYFEQAFDIKDSTPIEVFPGKEPSQKYLLELTEMIKEKDIKVIFSEPQFSPKAVQVLSSEYQLQYLELDPIGGKEQKDAYFEMMLGNLDAFKKAFAAQ
jgi:ABC-type Zn uptake system ZnuABC Zn-binding protein ZnuA